MAIRAVAVSPAILAALFFRQLVRWTHELPFDEKRRKDFA
jgi:hypothetical protein